MSEATDTGEAGISNRDVAKGAGTTLLARLGGVLELLTQPLYGWLFGLASLGFYGALWAAINLIENVADLGMTSAMQRVIPQARSPEEEASALRASFLLALVPCVIIAGIISVMAAPVATLFNMSDADSRHAVEAVRLFIWALPLWAFVEISTSALRSKRLFGAEIRLRLLWEQTVRLGLVLIFYVAGAGMMSLIYAHLLSLSIICVLCVRLLNRHFTLRLIFTRPVRDAMFVESLKAGLGVLPVNITTRLFGDGPALALNALIPGSNGAVAASLFIIARKVSSLVQLVRTIFAYVLAPLASAAASGGKDQVASIYGFSTRLSFALAVPMGAVLAASGPAALPLFGPGAGAALTCLIVLVLARVTEAVVGAATPIQQVTSGHLDQQLGSFAGLAVAGGIIWYFLPGGGLNAMAMAVGVGLVIAAVLPLFQLHVIDKLHPFSSPFGSVMGRTLAISVAGMALALLLQALPPVVQRIGFVVLVIALYRVSWKLSAGLALAGVAEVLTARFFHDQSKHILPYLLELTLLIPLLVGTLWASLRFALPVQDRQALGAKTMKRFHLG
jgi:O-antigen/teichoic acid export membrane protein